MVEIIRSLGIYAAVFITIELLSIINPRFPRLPGDIYLDKIGLKIYLPWLSSLIISVVIVLSLNFLKI